MYIDEIQYIQLLIFDFQNFSQAIGLVVSWHRYLNMCMKKEVYCPLTLASLLWIIYQWFLKYLLLCAFWNMLTSLYLFIAGFVLCLIGAFGYVDALQSSGLFNDEGDISYENNNGTLSEFTMSSFRCAAKCLQDMTCNAIELCSTPTGQTCRLSRGWKNTGGTLSQSTCRRFQIVGILYCLSK